MKTPLRVLLSGIALAAILTGASAESRARVAPIYKELIIQVPEMNEKSVTAVRKSLEDAGGMAFRGHCNDLDVLLYLVDVSVHPDYSFIDQALQPLSMTYLIKDGNIADMQARCGIDPSQPEAEQQ